MRLHLRNEHGGRTGTGRTIGLAGGLLTILAIGFALGRMNGAPHALPRTSESSASPAVSATTAPLPSATPHTQAGAVAAAANADCVLGGPLVLNPSAYRAALASVLAPNKVADAASLAEAESSQLDAQTGAVTAASGGTRVYVACVPLAYRVESSTSDSIAISVWTEQIAAVEGSFAPASAYITETLDMLWTAAGWRLESSQLLDTQWAPAPLESPLPQTGSLPAQMTTFHPLGGG